MRCPCDFFYEGKLKILPDQLLPKQTAPLPTLISEGVDKSAKNIVNQRLSFISTPVDGETPNRKTNRFEAEKIVELVRIFRGHGQHESIGIITPYRAQIALIKEALQQSEIDTEELTIDTVERYQGGARDIILISLCTNAASQMDSLVSLSEEGVDRKLNVALTRARERVVVLGNEALLSQNKVYRAFIEFCRSHSPVQEV
jgi:DNA replication ATP-dependent helicase Dna2